MKIQKFANFKRFRNFLIILVLELGILSVLTYNYTDKINENAVNEVMENNRSELERAGETLDTIIRQFAVRNVMLMFISGVVISLVLATHSYSPIRRIMSEIEYQGRSVH